VGEIAHEQVGSVAQVFYFNAQASPANFGLPVKRDGTGISVIICLEFAPEIFEMLQCTPRLKFSVPKAHALRLSRTVDQQCHTKPRNSTSRNRAGRLSHRRRLTLRLGRRGEFQRRQ